MNEITIVLFAFFAFIFLSLSFFVIMDTSAETDNSSNYDDMRRLLRDLNKSIQDIKCKLFDGNTDFEAMKENIFVLIYLMRVDVLDKKEKHKLKDDEELDIPSIQENRRISLGKAIDSIIKQIELIVQKTNLENEYHDIMNKGDLFYKIKAKMPSDM